MLKPSEKLKKVCGLNGLQHKQFLNRPKPEALNLKPEKISYDVALIKELQAYLEIVASML